MKKDSDYLLLLQERNRLRRMSSVKSQEDVENEKRERGFSTHFLGANKQLTTKTMSHVKKGTELSKKLTSTSSFGEEDATGSDIHRKGWAQEPPVQILGVNLSGRAAASADSDVNKGPPVDSHEEEEQDEQDDDDDDDDNDNDDDEAYEDDFEVISQSSENSLGVHDHEHTQPQSCVSAMSYLTSQIINMRPESEICLETHIPYSRQDIAGGQKFEFRIRIQSSWCRSQFVSIQQISIEKNKESNGTFKWVSLDILDEFTVTFSTGDSVYPKYNEYVRKSALLFRKKRSQLNQVWTFPFTNSVPLDINFSMNCEVDNPISFLEQCTLKIWNSRRDFNPIKDIDIYVGKECIFSGSISPAEQIDFAALPSLELRLTGQKIHSNSPSHSIIPSNIRDESLANSMPRPRPIWLSDLAAPAADFTSPPRSIPTRQTTSPPRSIPTRQTTSPPRSIPTGRHRRRLHSDDNRNINISLSKMNDSDVRQSLDTVAMVDRMNPGRLGGQLRKKSQEKGCSSHLDEIPKVSVLRTHRIDQVSSQVHAVIENIAQVIGNISRESPKVSPVGIKEVGEVQVDSPIELVPRLVGMTEAVSMEALIPIVQPHQGMPQGKKLTIEVLSTWGDEFYVGLNGIEIFDENGIELTLINGIEEIMGNPSDINILPEYSSDPRVVSNLINGINYTSDDLQVWLTPIGFFCPSPLEPEVAQDTLLAKVVIYFERVVNLSMIRIFNYNKNRTHSSRGVRGCRLIFGDAQIYQGEIRQAPGHLSSFEAASQIILFSEEEFVLKKIAEHDLEKGYFTGSTTISQIKQILSNWNTSNAVPLSTASLVLSSSGCLSDNLHEVSQEVAVLNISETHNRPTTVFKGASHKSSRCRQPVGLVEQTKTNILSSDDLFSCKELVIQIESTWGDMHYVGLCGLKILTGVNCTPLGCDMFTLSADPEGLSAIGAFDDPRVLANLNNEVHNTSNDEHMWLIPFTRGSSHRLKFRFLTLIELAGIVFWNYNKGTNFSGAAEEGVQRGVRLISIWIDENLFGWHELRQAPGCDGIDFRQEVLLRHVGLPLHHSPSSGRGAKQIISSFDQTYETLMKEPSGLLWRIVLHDNWNDGYYIGLDAIQLVDASGVLVDVDLIIGAKVSAVPDSLQNLGLIEDTRTPAALFKKKQNNCWLSPLSRCMTEEERSSFPPVSQAPKCSQKFNFPLDNTLFIMFDYPITLSQIIFFNYSKSPSRGVRNFSLFVDGKLIFMGELQPANSELEGVGQSVVFGDKLTNRKTVVESSGNIEQDVLCINEKVVIVRSQCMSQPPNAASEGILSQLNLRF